MINLKAHIRTLPPAARLELIAYITQTLQEDQATLTIPEEWIVEAQKVQQKIKEGSMETFSWEEVKTQLHGKKQ